MFLYDEEGTTRGKRVNSISNQDFCRVVSEIVRLSPHTDQATPTGLIPFAARRYQPLARPAHAFLLCRSANVERQALIKLRLSRVT